MRAFELVKANAGPRELISESLSDYEGNLTDIFTRYESAVVRQLFPTACEAGSHYEESRRRTTFGHPTVSDRIAQMVVKLEFEPKLSRTFYLILWLSE